MYTPLAGAPGYIYITHSNVFLHKPCAPSGSSVPPIPHLADTFDTDVRRRINSQCLYRYDTLYLLCTFPLLMLSWLWRQVALVTSTVSVTKCLPDTSLLSAIVLYINTCIQLDIYLWIKLTYSGVIFPTLIPVKINSIGIDTDTDAGISGILSGSTSVVSNPLMFVWVLMSVLFFHTLWSCRVGVYAVCLA